MITELRVGEVIEACTTDFVTQCYELYQSPSLGSLVKTRGDSQEEIYGVVYNCSTAGVEPGRRPIARGKDEDNEDEIYRASPQLVKLLRTDFSVLVLGFKKDAQVFQCLPSKTARIHSFVYLCSPEEVIQFSRCFDFLNILLKSRVDIPVEELIGSVIRQMSLVQGSNKLEFLVSAGKELAALLSADYGQLKAILKGLRYYASQ